MLALLGDVTAAASGGRGLPTPGAFSRVLAGWRPDGIAGARVASTDATGPGMPQPLGLSVAGATMSLPQHRGPRPLTARVRWQDARVPCGTVPTVEAGSHPAGAGFAQTTDLAQITVRKHNYMTRVAANGDIMPGSHRRRVPV